MQNERKFKIKYIHDFAGIFMFEMYSDISIRLVNQVYVFEQDVFERTVVQIVVQGYFSVRYSLAVYRKVKYLHRFNKLDVWFWTYQERLKWYRATL